MKWFFLILSATTLLLFQNCSMELGSSGNSSSKASNPVPTSLDVSGNGEGYDGKAYVEQNTDGSCGSDPLATKTAVEKRTDGFYQTMENCRSITPKKLADTEVGFEPVNQEVLIFNSRPLFQSTHFQKFDNLSLNSRLFCRGVYPPENGEPFHKVADVYFYSEDSSPRYFSSAIVGYYSGPTEYAPPLVLPEREVFEAAPNVGPGGTPPDVQIRPFDYNGGMQSPDGNPSYRFTLFVNTLTDTINQAALFINDDGDTSTPPPLDNVLDCYNY